VADLNLNLHPKQNFALDTEATEVLYGGAAGGGKSHLMRVAAIIWCSMIPGLQVYMFRRIRDDLTKNHVEGPKGYRGMLMPWTPSFARLVGDEIRFWNGSKIFLCHCKDEDDVYKYFGAEIHVLLIDELTHFTEKMYRLLRSRVRMVGMSDKIPAAWRDRFPRILCGSNPGNIGHHFVKKFFVDGAASYDIRQMDKAEGGMKRQFIRAVLEDNPSMSEEDPDYEMKLEGLGSDALVKALRWGDWDVVEGAYFDKWNRGKHVVRPFELDKHLVRFMSGDWGSAKPFSFGWWAVLSDAIKVENDAGVPFWLPRGCMVRYREWYGCKPGQEDVGLKLDAEEVGRGLVEREPATEKIDYRVLDPAAFTEDGGRSIEQRMNMGSKIAKDGRPTNRAMIFRKADNARVASRGHLSGWDQVRGRLNGDHEGRPMMVFFSSCLDSIRTIPALMHDKNRPEDVDTNGEDHAADDVRYGANSRPWARDKPQQKKQTDRSYTSGAKDDDDSWRTVGG